MSYGLIAGSFQAAAQAAEKERKDFEKFCDSLPKEDADKLRSERKAGQKKRREVYEQHQRDLDVAREGRSLNFWGNR